MKAITTRHCFEPLFKHSPCSQCDFIPVQCTNIINFAKARETNFCAIKQEANSFLVVHTRSKYIYGAATFRPHQKTDFQNGHM